MIHLDLHLLFPRLCRGFPTLLLAAVAGTLACTAQTKPAADAAPDVLTLSNGDTLHGKFVNEVA
jgi:hypothetical protein